MFLRFAFFTISFLFTSLHIHSAQNASISIFAGPVFTHMKNKLQDKNFQGNCASKTNPAFGISSKKNILWRTGAAYINKSYQYNVDATDASKVNEIEVHHKIESVKLFSGFAYSIHAENTLWKPMANITYARNKYVAAEYYYPAYPDYTTNYGEPLGDVNKGAILDSWGWEAGCGIQPKNIRL